MSNMEDDDYYLTRMKDILEGYPKLGPLQHPSKLLEHVYIGNQDNADNLDLLQALEITHVLNCAGTRTFDLTRSPYRPDTGIVGFLMMPAEDYEEFDIMQYFMDATVFLDKVKTFGGRALVHCNIGVNRSGAIVAAYLMVHLKRPLLQVIEDLKSKRSLILQNVGFRRQLVRFARCRGLLDLPDRPPKKPPTFHANGNASKAESTVNVTNQERSEVVKNISNGATAEEATAAATTSKENTEANNKGNTNGADNQLSKELSGEQNSGDLEEKNTPLPEHTGGGKYAGYENDLGNFDDKKEKSHSKVPRLDVPSLHVLKEDMDKSQSKFSYLDLGGFQLRARNEDLLTSPLKFTNGSVNSDYQISSGSRRLDFNRYFEEDLDSSKLSALSLEVPRSRVPKLSRQPYNSVQQFSSDLPYASSPLESIRDYHRSLRASVLDKAVSPASTSSRSQRISTESSLSDLTNSIHASWDDDDDDFTKYGISEKSRSPFSFAPVSSRYYESDGVSRDYLSGDLSKVGPKMLSVSAADSFVSTVKPRSYYQKLTPSSFALREFEDEEKAFGDKIRTTFERPFLKTRHHNEGTGMLFTPYLASSKSPSLKRSSLSYDVLYQPMPFVDKSYALENLFDRNTPYNRSSLSDIDSLNHCEFPLGKGTRSYPTPHRVTSSHRSALEYEDALDEYSDLLDASFGRPGTASTLAKNRVRSGPASGSRRAYKY